MAKSVFVLSSCDAWHMHSSYNKMGVFTSKAFAITKLKQHIDSNEDYVALSDDDKANLDRLNQTQGRNINFAIEEFTLNQIEE